MFKYIAPLVNPPLNPEVKKYLATVEQQGIQHWIPTSMQKLHAGKPDPQSLEEVWGRHDLSMAKGTALALADIAFIPEDKIDLEALRVWLVSVWDTFHPFYDKTVPFLPTNFRRAAKIYDWLVFGRKKTPLVPKGRETL